MTALKGLSPDLLRSVIVSVGTHRAVRTLSPMEVAEAIDQSIAAGANPQEVAGALGFEGTTMITRFRRLLRLPPEIRHMIAWGRGPSSISLTVAYELARLDSTQAHGEVATAALEHDLSSSEVRQIVQILHRSNKTPNEAIQSVLELRPQITRRHLLIGAIVSEKVREAIAKMTQRERDDLLSTALRRGAPGLPSWSGHLGPGRFSLMGGEDLAAAIRRLPGGFEEAVNTYLEAEVLR